MSGEDRRWLEVGVRAPGADDRAALLADGLIAQGADVLKLTIGVPELPMPRPVLDRMVDTAPSTVRDLDASVVADSLLREREVVVRRLQRAGVHCVDAVPEQVSVKGTRGEGLGPEGRGECVTALAVVLLEREERA